MKKKWDNIEDLIADLIKDEDIPAVAKVDLLNQWKDNLVQVNAGRLMSKEDASTHFDFLKLFQEAITTIQGIESIPIQ